jgi:hypothetical protein
MSRRSGEHTVASHNYYPPPPLTVRVDHRHALAVDADVHARVLAIITADINACEVCRWRGEALGQREVADGCARGYSLPEVFP